MRVLIITVRADYGGGPEHIYQLIKNSAGDIEYFVACPHDRPYYSRFQDVTGSERIIEIPHRRFDLKSFLRIYQFAKSNRIELIHSHGKGAGIYSRPLSALLRVPCIHTFHGLHIGTYGTVKCILYILLERCLSIFTDIIISVSKGESDALIKNHVVPKNKIKVIPNGVIIPDKNDYNYVAGKDKPIKIASVNRFDYQKNAELIVDIALHLQKLDASADFIIEVLGTGENFSGMQRLVEEKGVSDIVRLIGAVEDPRRYYRQALCFLSTSRWEGMPLAPLEAMSEGVTVIATNVVGNNDVIVHNETGLLYGLDEPQKAAENILELAGNKKNRERLSKNSYNNVKQLYNVATMAQATTKLYKNIIKS